MNAGCKTVPPWESHFVCSGNFTPLAPFFNTKAFVAYSFRVMRVFHRNAGASSPNFVLEFTGNQ